MRTVIVALSVLVMPGAVLAETPKAPSVKLDRNDPNYVICRRESVTGSLVQTNKVCLTRAQWAERTRESQAVGQDMQDRSRINSCGSSAPGGC